MNGGNLIWADQRKQSYNVGESKYSSHLKKSGKKLLDLKKRPFEDRTLSTPLISGEMLFAKKLKELALLKEHRCKYIDGIWNSLMNSANADLCCHKKRIPRGNLADFDLNARNHWKQFFDSCSFAYFLSSFRGVGQKKRHTEGLEPCMLTNLFFPSVKCFKSIFLVHTHPDHYLPAKTNLLNQDTSTMGPMELKGFLKTQPCF